jgi:hypothetical protein
MYETKHDHESHCVLRHAGKPAYPGPADMEADKPEPQGMPWEKLHVCYSHHINEVVRFLCQSWNPVWGMLTVLGPYILEW